MKNKIGFIIGTFIGSCVSLIWFDFDTIFITYINLNLGYFYRVITESSNKNKNKYGA